MKRNKGRVSITLCSFIVPWLITISVKVVYCYKLAASEFLEPRYITILFVCFKFRHGLKDQSPSQLPGDYGGLLQRTVAQLVESGRVDV